MKRLILAIAFIFLPTIAFADTWFVQVYTVPNAPVEIYDDEEIGRIEVSAEDKFVACAQAFTFKSWNVLQIAPLSVGFIYTGDKDKLKFESFGAVKRVMKLETKITKVE